MAGILSESSRTPTAKRAKSDFICTALMTLSKWTFVVGTQYSHEQLISNGGEQKRPFTGWETVIQGYSQKKATERTTVRQLERSGRRKKECEQRRAAGIETTKRRTPEPSELCNWVMNPCTSPSLYFVAKFTARALGGRGPLVDPLLVTVDLTFIIWTVYVSFHEVLKIIHVGK